MARNSRITVTWIWPGYWRSSSSLRAIRRASSRAPRSSTWPGIDHHPHLPPGLHRKDLLDAGEVRSQRSPAAPAGVRSDSSASRRAPGRAADTASAAWTRTARMAAGLDLVVMGLDPVDHGRVLPEAPSDLGADQGMGALRPRGSPPCRCHGAGRRASPEPGRSRAREASIEAMWADLDQMVEHVLAVAGPVLEPAQQTSPARSASCDTPTSTSAHSPASRDRLLDLGPGLLVGLFDRGGVDAAVGDQLLQGDPGHLPTHRVEGRRPKPPRGCRRR